MPKKGAAPRTVRLDATKLIARQTAMGWTVGDFAAATGVSEDTFTRIYKGDAVAVRTAAAIAEGLGQQVTDLLLSEDLSTLGLPFEGRIQEFFDQYLIAEEGLGTVPFGGREEELELLNQWLDDENSPPRFVLAAPAGRGKSALLVRWRENLINRQRIGTGDVQWHLVFVPISQRSDTNRPEIFYEAIAARLARVVSDEVRVATAHPAIHYEDECSRLLRLAIERSTRVLVILDGLDEALGDCFEARWFPRVVGTDLRLLVSARAQVGASDARGWAYRLGWNVDIHVELHDLRILNYKGVRHLLEKSGAPLDVLATRPEIVERIHELSEGEPLLLRLYVADLWKMGDKADVLTLEKLRGLGRGFPAYFKDWMRRQRDAWRLERLDGAEILESVVYAHLAVLACAHGPLPGHVLSDLVCLAYGIAPAFQTDDALYPLRRFIVSKGADRNGESPGYVLSHPKFGEFARDFLNKTLIEKTKQAFARWGESCLTEINKKNYYKSNTPPYLLNYLSQHLLEIPENPSKMSGLLEEGWFRAWFAYEKGYRGFSDDVQRVLVAAERTSDGEESLLALQLRAMLILSSLASVGSQIPIDLLIACFEYGVVGPGQTVKWLEYQENRGEAVCAIAPRLGPDVLEAVLTIATSISDSWSRVKALTALSLRFPLGERDALAEEALRAALRIDSDWLRVRALIMVSEVLPHERRTGIVEAALKGATGLRKDGLLAEALFAIAGHLPANLKENTVMKAAAIQVDWLRIKPLAALLVGSQSEQCQAMVRALLTSAKQIPEPGFRAEALGALLPCLMGPERVRLLEDCLEATLKIEFDPYRIVALESLLPHLQGEMRAQALRAAVAAANTIRYGEPGVRVWSRLAELLPEAERIEAMHTALASARAISDRRSRAKMIGKLARQLSPVERSRILEGTLAEVTDIGDTAARAAFLCALVRHLPVDDRELEIEAALAAATTIQDDKRRATVLMALVPYLVGAWVGHGLEAIERIEDAELRLHATLAILPNIGAAEIEPICVRIRYLISDVRNVVLKVDALSLIAGYLPEKARDEIFKEALAVGMNAEKEEARAHALIAIAQRLPMTMLDAALTEVNAITTEPKLRYQILATILPRASGRDLEKIIKLILVPGWPEHHEFLTSGVLPKVAQYLTAEQLKVGMAQAEAIKNKSLRAWCLSAFAPYLNESDKNRVIEIVSSIVFDRNIPDIRKLEYSHHYAYRLHRIHEREEIFSASECFNLSHSAILLSIIPHMTEVGRKEAIGELFRIVPAGMDQMYRAHILMEIAAHLPAGSKEASLRAAMDIPDATLRGKTLEKLARFVPEAMREKVLGPEIRKGLECSDERFRTNVLTALVPYVPVALQLEVLPKLIQSLSKLPREQLLAVFLPFLPLIRKVGGVTALHELRRAVVETAEWLP